MKIKVKRTQPKGQMPIVHRKGDWFDLICPEDVELTPGTAKKVDFCLAMQLPAGFEAHVLERSSTFKNYGILQTNALGIIDNSYCGDKDSWGGMYYCTRKGTIPAGSRIAQFRIVLSQRATFWQKLKWLFNSKIRFVEVDRLGNKNRGGFGEGTGR